MAVTAQGQATTDRHGQAVVLGGRMAGTLAARVLADHYERVLIIDRDEPATRRALWLDTSTRRRPMSCTPAQTLSPDGASRLERMWPGLVGELVDDGVATIGRDHLRATAAAQRSPGSVTLQATRSFFGHHLWRRLATADKITRLAGLDAVGLVATGDRCGGVWVISRTPGAAARTIPADLVVDAMGVGSRLSRWLADTWHASVPTERSEAAFRYVSQRYRLPSWTPAAAVRRDVSPDRRYDWMIMAVEDGDHVVTVRGSNHGPQSVDPDQFDALVSTKLAADLAAAVRSGRPTGALSFYTRFAPHRRRFDRALGLPDGLLALGGSLDGTDPLLGMALSHALIQADLLDESLHSIAGYGPFGRSSLTRRYFEAALADNRRSHTHDSEIMLMDGPRRIRGRGPSSQ